VRLWYSFCAKKGSKINKALENERAVKKNLMYLAYVQNILKQKYFLEYDSTGKQPTCPYTYQDNPYF